MARIPDSEIERLKTEISVERLVESAGIALKKSGKDLLGKCPYHADDQPSLVVTPAKNLWHCFGCQSGGGPIDWMMKKNGVSFRHAVELLREGVSSPSFRHAGAGLAADAGKGAVKRTTVRALPAPVAFDADDQVLLAQVMDYYRETLKQSPEALAYLKARGLDHPELIDTFKLGYANRTLGLRLPTKQRKDGADIRARLEKIGIYAASGHERYNGSLVIPVFDENGTISEVYGRKIRDDLRKGTAKHLCLPEACRAGGRGVWNIAALAASKEIILCEALIDAMTFWCAGYRNVTASYGMSGFSDDHLAAFKQYGTRRVLIAYDRDVAGDAAVPPLVEILTAAGIECFRIEFPKGMDANEYALKVTPAVKSLGVVIRKAVWLGKGAAPERENEISDIAQIHPAPVLKTRRDAPLESLPATQSVAIASATAAPGSSPGQAWQESPPASPLAAEAAEPTPVCLKPGEETLLPASPVPSAPTADTLAEVSETDIVITFAQGAQPRRWRVRGLSKNLSHEVLKVNVSVSCAEGFYLDVFNLYSQRHRASFAKLASIELRVPEALLCGDLARVFRKLEELQQEAITQALKPKPIVAVQMEEAERVAALNLLCDPKLMERITADLGVCGLVGERTNKQVGYLAAVSRKLGRPLGVVIQSSSAAGKTTLMDAVLDFVPEEERVKYSAMTGQALFYMGQTHLKHKVLAIVEEEGASRASYALKLLQSEGELTMAATGKDPQTGNLVTQPYRVEGPVALLFTTTARDVDEELMNRCLVLTVDESREQTRAIHHLQRDRRTLEGLIGKREREEIMRLHQNAQRLLKPLDVLNPYAQFLTFPDQTTRLRRDHEKYLTLIDVIAYLHQHQRQIKTHTRGQGEQSRTIEYVEVSVDDITLANTIAHEVLGRSLDELPPQTRRLLRLIDRYVQGESERLQMRRGEVRFARRALREAIAWGDTQLKIHLARLSEMEYLAVHRARANGFEYELVYEAGDDGVLRFPGLADIETLKYAYDTERSGQNTAWSAPGRPPVGGRSGGGRGGEMPAEPINASFPEDWAAPPSKTQVFTGKGNGKNPSYAPVVSIPTNAAAAAD